MLLVDARNGVVEQTRRHAAVLALLRRAAARARHQQDRPRRLRRGAADGDRQGLHRAGPLARLRGRRRRRPSPCRRCSATTSSTARTHTPWYDGPDAAASTWSRCRWTGPEVSAPFRMPVQYVIRRAPPPRLPRLRGPGRGGHRHARRRGRRCCPAARNHRRPRIDTADGPLPAAQRGPQRHDPAGRRHRPLARRRTRRRIRSAHRHGRARRRPCAGCRRQAAAPWRAAAGQARHPHHPGDRRRVGRRSWTPRPSPGSTRPVSSRSTTSAA